jgi:hypothetical protein
LFAGHITGGHNFFRKLAKNWRTRRIFSVPAICTSGVLALGAIAMDDCAGAWIFDDAYPLAYTNDLVRLVASSKRW